MEAARITATDVNIRFGGGKSVAAELEKKRLRSCCPKPSSLARSLMSIPEQRATAAAAAPAVAGGDKGKGALTRIFRARSQTLSFPLGDNTNLQDDEEKEEEGAIPTIPVLPIFTQLNVRNVGSNKKGHWKEASRWVKFQEDVEDGGKRWSKPYVPAFRLSAIMDLRKSLEEGIVALDVDGKYIDEIIDEVYYGHDDDSSRPDKALNIEQFEELKKLLGQRVKQRMKLNIIGKMTSVAGGGGGGAGSTEGSSEGFEAPDIMGMEQHFKSAPASRQQSKESLQIEGDNGSAATKNQQQPPLSDFYTSLEYSREEVKMDSSEAPNRSRSISAARKSITWEDVPKSNSITRSNSISCPTRDKSVKLREHNMFTKKVPKGAESCIVFVAAVDFALKPVTLFVRLKRSVILEDFCEIPSPTRFLAIILGPAGEDAHRLQDMGKAMGTIMADQIFPLVAYRARNVQQIFSGLDCFTQGVTVLAPSVWDHKTRLDPPKVLPTLDNRLSLMRQRSPRPSLRPPTDDDSKLATSGEEDEHEEEDDYMREKDRLLFGLRKNSLNNAENGKGDGHESTWEEEVAAEFGGEGYEDEALQRTGKLFGGLVLDVKRKWSWYLSDFTDAIHVQTLASVIYIYLATITKAITFGGFLGDITGGLQGVLESFLGHAVAGGFFCLFGGQPLTVLGCTGPVLIFEKILVDFCSSWSMDYMTFRLWIGLWSMLYCLIIVATDASSVVRYITRFSEESFAALIGIIFIVESLKKLYTMSVKYPVNIGFEPDLMTLPEEGCACLPPEDMSFDFLSNLTISHAEEVNHANYTLNGTLLFDEGVTEEVPWSQLTVSQCKLFGGVLSGHACPYVPDVFFFSVILFFGTFSLASALKKFKLTPYFPAKVRSLTCDYAIIIAILVFVGIDLFFDLHTPKLIVPKEFKPTRSDIRGWFIPFVHESLPWYCYLATSIPALLLSILLFMDQQITSVIVNRSEHKLKKGCGYHLDMLIVGLMIGLCSVTGLPWCVAATVLCLGHVDSLKTETETSAPGERPQFLGVREQRVTGTMVFLLTGLSVKLAPILKYIPMPVLYGVLLYMGISALKGMQFVDRIGLLFMPPKYQPDHVYLRHVPLKKVHLFTIIQITGLALLWIIKSTPASLIFPLMVLALVFLRKAMDYFPRVFTQHDLFWLDNLMPDSKKDKNKTKDESETSKAESKEEKTHSDVNGKTGLFGFGKTKVSIQVEGKQSNL